MLYTAVTAHAADVHQLHCLITAYKRSSTGASYSITSGIY